MVNRNAKRYLRQVSGWLPCAGKMKKQIIEEIRSSVSHYLEKNVDTTYQQIVSRFGTPQQIAASYVEETDALELLRKLSIKRRIVKIIVCGVALVCATWLIIFGVALIQNYDHSNGYGVTYIVEG